MKAYKVKFVDGVEYSVRFHKTGGVTIVDKNGNMRLGCGKNLMMLNVGCTGVSCSIPAFVKRIGNREVWLRELRVIGDTGSSSLKIYAGVF